MRKGDKKLFNDPETLNFMLNLRIKGFSVHSLSDVFHCDRKSIKFQCSRYQIFPENKKISVRKQINSFFKELPKPIHQIKIVEGERVNLGRSYADYLKS